VGISKVTTGLNNYNPSVCIITAVLNGEDFLESVILSVINQTYKNVRHIIIDGGSTDGTLDIIKKYENKIFHWESGVDKGISDAFNKGLKVSNCDYINFQGCGDGFISNDTLDNIFLDINPSKDVLISTRVKRVDYNGKFLYLSKYSASFNKRTLLFKMSMSHQGLFVHKIFFKKYGLFDVHNKYCMDYEHLLRGYKNFPNVVTKDIVAARWRYDGIGRDKTLDILKEYNHIRRKNKVANSFFLYYIKHWSYFKYFYKKIFYKK